MPRSRATGTGTIITRPTKSGVGGESVRLNRDNNCRILVLLGLQESMFLVLHIRIPLTQASIFDNDND